MYWRIIAGVFAILLVVGLSSAYHLGATVVGKQKDFESQVRQWVQERTTIAQIATIDEYRGKESYAVVTGVNKAGTPVIVWMTADTIAFDTMERMVTRESVEAAVKKGFPQGEIYRIVAGIDGEKRFWEVTVRDEEGRFHYLHYDLYTGALLTSYVIHS